MSFIALETSVQYPGFALIKSFLYTVQPYSINVSIWWYRGIIQLTLKTIARSRVPSRIRAGWSGRTSNQQRLVPTFTWIKNCLIVTKQDFLEALLWLNEQSEMEALLNKCWFYLCSLEEMRMICKRKVMVILKFWHTTPFIEKSGARPKYMDSIIVRRVAKKIIDPYLYIMDSDVPGTMELWQHCSQTQNYWNASQH